MKGIFVFDTIFSKREFVGPIMDVFKVAKIALKDVGKKDDASTNSLTGDKGSVEDKLRDQVALLKQQLVKSQTALEKNRYLPDLSTILDATSWIRRQPHHLRPLRSETLGRRDSFGRGDHGDRSAGDL